jgi:hypothetical protein
VGVLIVIVIIILVVLGVSLVAWKSQTGPGKATLKPGPNNQQLIDPAQAPQVPGQADFLIKPDPGFVVQSRTDGKFSPPPPVPGGQGPVTTANGFGQVTQNLTAICRLTGKQVTDCSCTRCSAIKKKRKAL